MESYIEELVATFLTIDGKVFIAGQFEVAFDKDTKEGGSCPDFVALDFERKEVIVVEVSTSADPKALRDRVSRRGALWYEPIRRQFARTTATRDFAEWPIRFLGFLRSLDDVVEKEARRFSGQADVCFYPLERALLPYEYSGHRKANGLPR